jgi:heme/copper-type cytochrome/quinol oxidase subunit 4
VSPPLPPFLSAIYILISFLNPSLISTIVFFIQLIRSSLRVSSAAALVCWTYCDVRLHRSSHAHDWAHHLFERYFACFRSPHFTPRHRATYLFVSLYLVLTILLCVSLDNWALDQPPGRCYFSHLVTGFNASHPTSDLVYVSITASWMMLVMMAAALSGSRWRHTILVLAFLQFPVHLYMALALRSANQGKLEGNGYENGWDFGQTTAVILLAVAVREVFDKGLEYFFFEKDLKKNRALSNRNGKRDRHDDDSNSHELNGVASAEEGHSFYNASGAIYGERLGERSSLAKTASKATNSGDSKMEERDGGSQHDNKRF